MRRSWLSGDGVGGVLVVLEAQTRGPASALGASGLHPGPSARLALVRFYPGTGL